MPFLRATASSSCSTSSSAAHHILTGELQLLDPSTGDVVQRRQLLAGKDVILGRDKARCQWYLDDPYLSAKQLRIYTVIYENEQDSQIDPLVYAEDLSRYGVYWNGSLIGKGNGGFLLSHEDKLRLSSQTILRFIAPSHTSSAANFDLVQEREMKAFQDEYILTDRLLGAGAYGRVFMAVEYATRTQVACKVVDLRVLRESSKSLQLRPIAETPASAGSVNTRAQLRKVKIWADSKQGRNQLNTKMHVYYREVEILSSISHPNIVSVDKVVVTDNTMYMFMDLITAGDLFSYLEMKNHKLLESEAAVIVRQIVIAICFLHQNGIVHRDLKPDNVMITSISAGARVVLTDFGAARRIDTTNRRMHSLVGTEEYTAPEVITLDLSASRQSGSGYTSAVDMWSLGAIAVILLTGTLAFADPMTGLHSTKLASTCNLDHLQKSAEWRQVRPRPKDFVTKLLVLDENLRMTADQALHHAWFSNQAHKLDFEDLYKRTVRGWHPRVPKSQVIVFQNSVEVKYLPSSRKITDAAKKPQNIKKPVEPPYIPFPRKMHMEFWPRKRSSFSIPSEIKAIIAQHWSPAPRKPDQEKWTSPPRSKPSLHNDSSVKKIRQNAAAAAKESALEKQDTTTTTSNISGMADCLSRARNSSLHLPEHSKPSELSVEQFELVEPVEPVEPVRRQVSPTPIVLPLRSVGLPTAGTSSIVQDDARPRQTTGSEDVRKLEDLSNRTRVIRQVASIPPTTLIQPVRRLQARSASSDHKAVTISSGKRKRRRNSIYDFDDDDDSSSGDGGRLLTPKRTRMNDAKSSDMNTAHDQELCETTPHHESVMLSVEYD